MILRVKNFITKYRNRLYYDWQREILVTPEFDKTGRFHSKKEVVKSSFWFVNIFRYILFPVRYLISEIGCSTWLAGLPCLIIVCLIFTCFFLGPVSMYLANLLGIE